MHSKNDYLDALLVKQNEIMDQALSEIGQFIQDKLAATAYPPLRFAIDSKTDVGERILSRESFRKELFAELAFRGWGAKMEYGNQYDSQDYLVLS